MNRVVVVLFLVTAGCMSDNDRDLHRMVQIPCSVTEVNSTEYRFDNIIVEYPNGNRRRIRSPRGLYRPGDTYHVEMRRWRAIELYEFGSD